MKKLTSINRKISIAKRLFTWSIPRHLLPKTNVLFSFGLWMLEGKVFDITKITKLSTSPQEISNAISIFVKSCDQNVSSFWSHDFLFIGC